MLLGWLCLPQEAKHPGNVRFIVSLLLSFATFLSGNALMLLSLNLLGRLREDLVSGSQRAASKCTLLLVACAVLSVLTLLSVMVALLPGRSTGTSALPWSWRSCRRPPGRTGT